jgi:NADPH:quinone reductase-like Zn-dependent oxidoreductase
MRSLRLLSPGKIAIEDVPVPEIEADEVLVQVAGAGLCHSDIHVLRSPYSRLTALTLGHETAGYVADIGRDVREVAEQDPVLVYLVWASDDAGHASRAATTSASAPVGTEPHRAPAWARTAAWRSTSRSKPGTSSHSETWIRSRRPPWLTPG